MSGVNLKPTGHPLVDALLAQIERASSGCHDSTEWECAPYGAEASYAYLIEQFAELIAQVMKDLEEDTPS
jgi:hypothetical protein